MGGMFEKDKEIGIIVTNLFQLGEPFILWDAKIGREDFPTSLGPATQSRLTVSRMDSPGEKYEATTLASAIAAKVREAVPEDFPAVVTLAKVPSSVGGQDALVIQYLKAYGNQPSQPAPAQSGAQEPAPY